MNGDTLVVTKENTAPQEVSNLTVFITSEFMEPFLGTIHSVIKIHPNVRYICVICQFLAFV